MKHLRKLPALIVACLCFVGVKVRTRPPGFSRIRSGFLVPGMGTIHGFCARTRPRAICAGVALLASSPT